MNYKIIGSTVTAAILGGALVIVAFYIAGGAEARALNLLVLITGASAGWLLGVVASPYDPRETTAFPKYVGAVSAFASGYVVSKLDRVLEHLLQPEFVTSAIGAFRLLGGVCALVLGVLVTYIYRSYAR